MIIIGLGGNLPSRAGPPQVTLQQALVIFEEKGIKLIARSPFYGSHPVPATNQPDYVNAVALVQTDLSPGALLTKLLAIEMHFGRRRAEVNAARAIDLDLLAYDDLCLQGGDPAAPGLILPHPRMHLRAFVLAPLCDIAPEWIHPGLHRSGRELYAALPENQSIWRV